MLDNLNAVWENITTYLLAGGAIVVLMGTVLLTVTVPRGNPHDIGLSAWLFVFGLVMCAPAIWRYFNKSV